MLCEANLTPKEFSNVHNALCELRRLADQLEYTIHPNVHKSLIKSIAEIRSAFEESYNREDKIGRDRHEHYAEVQRALGIIHSVWSIDSVSDLYSPHPYKNATKVCYQDYWGERKDIEVHVEGDRWADLWVAADKAIAQSGDSHHIFIEAFMQVGGELILSTGS